MFRRPGRRRDEEGQIIVLFALMLTVIMLVASLLYTGAQTLVLRRQLQNAGDAAALAAANLMEAGNSLCSSTRIASVGVGNDLFVAARSSVETNLGWSDATVASKMTLACPADTAYGGVAITVSLNGIGPRYFGGPSLPVNTSSTALNGQTNGNDFSVALLDKSDARWAIRPGCPSYLFNGGVTITYEGSIMVDSICKTADSTSGAVKAQNSAFTMTLLNGATMQVGGEVSSGTITRITPTPIQNFRPLFLDPLSGLVEPCHVGTGANCLGPGALPARDAGQTGQGQCKSTKVACVLLPGTYSGGILAANGNHPPTLLLRPGVYYIEGGGFQLKSAAAQIVAIPSTTGTCGGVGLCTDSDAITRYCNPSNNNNGSCQLTATQVGANWNTDCPPPPATPVCGVMIYNAKSDLNTGWTTTGASADQIQNGAQGVLLLRAYNPVADTTNGSTFASYKNVVIWQARDPLPASGSPQPIISMAGGACVVMSGTVYANGAELDFGGSTCAVGGGADPQMTLQFVVWDLTLAGNNNFYFAYRKGSFASPFGYGLVK